MQRGGVWVGTAVPSEGALLPWLFALERHKVHRGSSLPVTTKALGVQAVVCCSLQHLAAVTLVHRAIATAHGIDFSLGCRSMDVFVSVSVHMHADGAVMG
jgi:hypothetical protein